MPTLNSFFFFSLSPPTLGVRFGFVVVVVFSAGAEEWRKKTKQKRRRKGGGSRTSWKTRDIQNDEGCGCCGLSDMLESCPPVESFSPCVSGVRETLVAICEAFPTHTHTKSWQDGENYIKKQKRDGPGAIIVIRWEGRADWWRHQLVYRSLFCKKERKSANLVLWFVYCFFSARLSKRKIAISWNHLVLLCWAGRIMITKLTSRFIISDWNRSDEIGAFAAQFRDSCVRFRFAGGGQWQQDGGPGGWQLVRPAHAQVVEFLSGQETDQDRIERAPFRSRRFPRQARLCHYGASLQGHPCRGRQKKRKCISHSITT